MRAVAMAKKVGILQLCLNRCVGCVDDGLGLVMLLLRSDVLVVLDGLKWRLLLNFGSEAF